MSWKIMLLFLILFLVVGCGEEEVWDTINDDAVYFEVTDFMEDYSNEWNESLRIQNFSMMERFFIPNSQVYHMQRRQHQSLSAERKVEVLKKWTDPLLEGNEYGEYRWKWTEYFEVEQGQSVVEEVRTRVYYISRDRNNAFKITAISRVEQ